MTPRNENDMRQYDDKQNYGVVPFDSAMVERGHEGRVYYRRGEKLHWMTGATPATLREAKWIHLYSVGYMLFADIEDEEAP